MPELTKEEQANGWTETSLAQYRADRDEAADLKSGNVVTEWDKPRPGVRIENTRQFNPHKW